jgi:hypothetical protein
MKPHDEILQLLQNYFEGVFTGDVKRLREVFHPQAMLFGEVKGAPYLRGLDEYLEVVAKRQSPQSLGETLAMQVMAIDVQGPVAVARASCPMLGYHYIDFLSLTRQNGRWQIANKTFTHVPAAAATEA